ncbi:MAG: Nif3-like dinuclear metal center hexameric protein, partial [Planctomycetaceae bacterium]|nr:Nif3-like dinuclear metal center hexameric protein [Planctomycetaceae bacterium]
MKNTVADVIRFMESLAAPQLAEEWDNVGLLLGDEAAEVQSVMTCLTLTPDVADEAVRQKSGLIITHHPILFRAIKKLTTATDEGRMLLQLIQAGVAVYSPHTA